MTLDKFYTDPAVAIALKQHTYALLGADRPKYVMEPSAGGGAFLEDGDAVVSFDLSPDVKGGRTLQHDQLGFDTEHRGGLDPDFLRIVHEEAGEGRNILVIGNPPFGERSALAVQFVNEYLGVGGVVAFVIPVTFKKWSVQKRIRPDAQLIANWHVPADAFHLPDGSPYRIRCVFQVWSIRPEEHRHPDLRLKAAPARSHPDFQMKRWNRVGDMEKAFAWDFDFAVRCQGHVNYREQFPAGFRPSDKSHYMMFKANSPPVLTKLRSMDFEALAKVQMITPGFGMADLVEAYEDAGNSG